jgi:seryl-tRNA synthetase
MRDLHEQAKNKQESLCGQIDEIVNLKQMEIVKLQKELEALQKVRQVLSTELAAGAEKSEDSSRTNNKLISSVKAALAD